MARPISAAGVTIVSRHYHADRASVSVILGHALIPSSVSNDRNCRRDESVGGMRLPMQDDRAAAAIGGRPETKCAFRALLRLTDAVEKALRSRADNDSC